jgi:hypothetical protein
MASYYGSNYTNIYQNNPSEPAEVGQAFGKVKMLYDEFTLTAEIDTPDTLFMCHKLPAGALVIDAAIIAPSLGTTGILQLGHSANGVDANDVDAFVQTADAGGQAVIAKPAAGAAGIGKKFTVETEIKISCTEITQAGIGDTVKCYILYVLD